MPRRPKHRPDSDGVEIKLVNRARSDIGAPLADQHRVAIRWRVDNAADTDGTTSTGSVFHDNGLIEHLAHAFRH